MSNSIFFVFLFNSIYNVQSYMNYTCFSVHDIIRNLILWCPYIYEIDDRDPAEKEVNNGLNSYTCLRLRKRSETEK